MVIKLACPILALKTSAAKVSNSGVVIYLSLTLFLIYVTLVLKSALLTKLLTIDILFSTAVNAVFVAKLLTSGVLPSFQ